MKKCRGAWSAVVIGAAVAICVPVLDASPSFAAEGTDFPFNLDQSADDFPTPPLLKPLCTDYVDDFFAQMKSLVASPNYRSDYYNPSSHGLAMPCGPITGSR